MTSSRADTSKAIQSDWRVEVTRRMHTAAGIRSAGLIRLVWRQPRAAVLHGPYHRVCSIFR